MELQEVLANMINQMNQLTCSVNNTQKYLGLTSDTDTTISGRLYQLENAIGNTWSNDILYKEWEGDNNDEQFNHTEW